MGDAPLRTQRLLFDPTTGQEFLELDPLRGVVGSGSKLVTLALGDVTLITVPTGKEFVMTNFRFTPIGLGIAGVTSIWNGPSAGADLRRYIESILATISPIQERDVRSKRFDSDVIVTTNLVAGGYIEVGGYLIDLDPEP